LQSRNVNKLAQLCIWFSQHWVLACACDVKVWTTVAVCATISV